MVSKTVPRNKVFSWHLTFETSVEDGDWYIPYYDPNGVDMYKIRLDAATKTLAKSLQTQVQAWMNTVESWSGAVVEHWQKKRVTKPAETVEDWGLV